MPFESISVKQGDSDWVNGGGTGGSRSLTMSGGALLGASDEVIRKGKTAAGQVLQAGGAEVGFEVVEGVGRFRVADSERAMTVGELAMTLKRDKLPGFENGLDSDATFEGKASTFPNGCHICEVEIDPGNRQGRHRLLCRARRFRPRHQSDAGRGPGAWRCRAGPRPGR